MSLLVATLALTDSAWADTRRFALIAGANDGGADRVELQYAITDATAVGGVLAELGGIPRSNQTLLIEPDGDVLRDAIENLSNTVAQAEAVGMRTEVVFYYSGHSDESGLLLGESRYAYPDLKQHLEAIPADVKVVILDSCASGAMVRTKGGVARPAFLEDRTNDVEGTAYVMSSAADEASQESDVVGASYFTHFLVSGMRGAADRSLDGRVTLHEAWDFAARETLERTERTSIGAQHPFFHRDLGGHGDFVFTDLTQTTSSLIFDESLEGRLFVRDVDGDLIAELAKPIDESVEVALGAGSYTVVLQQGDDRYEAYFDILEAEHMLVDDLEFAAITPEAVRARGGQPKVVLPPEPAAPPPLPEPAPTEAVTSKESAPIQVGVATEGGKVNYQLGVFATEAETVQGAQTSALYNQADTLQGVQMTVVANVVRATSAGWQASVVANIASEQLVGAQVAFVNGAKELKGMQAGLVNHAGSGGGVQFGLINSGGDSKGLQLGLINVARDYDGVALGLINVHKSGYSHFSISSGYPQNMLLGVTFGSRYVYTSIQLGAAFYNGASINIAMGGGVHLPIRRGYIDTDVVAGWRMGGKAQGAWEASNTGQFLIRNRFQFGYEVAKHFAIQTGPEIEWYPPFGSSSDGRGSGDNFGVGDELLLGWSAGFRF